MTDPITKLNRSPAIDSIFALDQEIFVGHVLVRMPIAAAGPRNQLAVREELRSLPTPPPVRAARS
jgi:hypothetical protein